jgi:formylglycine-generating enzyme required for sulfatase activity
VDAVTRPSKPYLPPDRGFGHEGYAAICLSHASATEFCRWLSARSGKKFRLATEDEWELACGSAPAKEAIGELAWGAGNAEAKPHHVATKSPNALGVYDMLGNVAEWVDGRDGKPVTKGGSYKTPLEELSPALRQKQDRSWNSSDPQVPKSKWWLADGPFVGFRIVSEPGTDAGAKPEDGKKESER